MAETNEERTIKLEKLMGGDRSMDKIEELEGKIEDIDGKLNSIEQTLIKIYNVKDTNNDGVIDYKDLFNEVTKKLQIGAIISQLIMAGFLVIALFL